MKRLSASVMIASLVLYALFGGADYGGGVWDLFAFGRRAREQRALIADAISPVWEANHVWLILVIVILFTAFPPAFAAIATALHIPITLLLIGIVLRGTAFTFRTYDVQRDDVQRRWSLIFSIASIITPILLGTILGAIASGTIRVENGAVTTGFFNSWLAPFPFAVGFFALALFAFLAAVYLTLETRDRELQEDFRRRALVSGAIVGLLALTVFILAQTGAPTVRAGISRSSWALGLHVCTALFTTSAFYALWTRRYGLARLCVAAQVTLILLGWAFAQYPHIVEPDLTIASAAAPPVTLQLLLGALLAGVVLLFPSYYYLFRILRAEPRMNVDKRRLADRFSDYLERQLTPLKAVSIGLALLAFCIGGAALLGWILNNPYLKRIHPSLVTMKANTAVCLMLVGVSCILINDRSPSQIKRGVIQLFAAIVGLIGLVTLSEHIFGWNTGLDQVLFYESRAEAGLSFPGRMGVAASLNFFFLGIALSFFNASAKRWFRVSNVAVLLVVTVTLLVFLYYFYGIDIEPIAQYFTIALHTVVAFLSICTALLLARPERGFVAALLDNSPGAIVARRMLPAFLVVILLGWIRTLTRNAGWFSPGFATAFFVLAVLILLAVLIWLTALSLNRTDRERRLVDLALRHSEAHLTALLEQLPVGIGLTDGEGRFLIRNSLMNNFVGDRLSSLDPVYAARWRAWDEDGRILDPSEWPSARALRGESVSPGCEMLYTAADGKQIWTRVLSVPFRDQADELSGVIVVVQDIDEQRRAEKRLDVLVRVSELIRTIQEPYELSYAVAETVGSHLNVRRCLFNETDVERDLEIVHRDYTDGAASVAGEHRISEYSSITSEEMKRGNTVVNSDSKTDPRTAADYERSYGPTGERAYIAVPLMRDGRWVASLWASDDRPRQWTKEELSLLQTVAERTWTAIEKLRAEAERERLLTSVQEARDAAEKANQLKDEFLATLSHELRNPLNVILGYSELLLRMREVEQAPHLAQMGEALRRNAQSQSQLINDLLDLSRLQRGKISLNQETVSLPAIIDNAVETVRADAAAKGLDIRVNVGDQLLLVEGDRLRLQQIAWNLLNNAVKFTPAGGSIEIALRNENENAVFVVTDTGQGIDASFLPHVFEMFRQADGSNRRRHGGLGIGLALVRQLVQLHGGNISAESDGPNKGARFTVRLPLLRETARLRSPVVASSSPVELNAFAQTNFLIVDDSEDTIAMLQELLKVAGANVMSATNGADALRIAAENEFDVILSDISMPEMDGFEFLQRLRKIDGRQNVPVIAITGFGRHADIARARAAGFYSHLTKPLNLQVLTEVLQQLAKEKAELSGTATDVDYDISAGPVF